MTRPPLIGVTGWRETIEIDCGPYLTLALESHYADLVDEAGGMPVVLAGGDATAEAIVERMDGLLITGGPDVDPAIYGHERHPRTGTPDHQRDALEVALVRAALRRGMPVLAICRGCQLVAAALGGTLEQHVDGHFELGRPEEVVHEVDVLPGTVLAQVLGAGRRGVNSLHHQAVADPGPDLIVSALLPDGSMIEGVEHRTAPILAVQWHPEKQGDLSAARLLFGWLVEQSARFAATTAASSPAASSPAP